MHHYKIKPKIGIGEISFYCTTDDFIESFGEPNEDEIHDNLKNEISKNIIDEVLKERYNGPGSP